MTTVNCEVDVLHQFASGNSSSRVTFLAMPRSTDGSVECPPTLVRLTKRVGEKSKLKTHTKTAVHSVCALATLLHGDESWTSRRDDDNNEVFIKREPLLLPEFGALYKEKRG